MAATNFYFVNTAFNPYTADYAWVAPLFSWKGSWDWVHQAGDGTTGPVHGDIGLLSPTKAVGSWIEHQNSDLALADPPPPVFPGRTVGLTRFATIPLAAQALNGTVDLRIGAFNWYGDSQLGTREVGPGGPYLYTKIFLWVSVGETDVIRSILLDYTEDAGSGSYWPIQDQTPNGPYRIIGLGMPQTVVGEVFLGDRIVLELGNISQALTDQADVGAIFAGTFDSFGGEGGGPTFSASPDAVLGETGFEYVNLPEGTYKVDNRAGFLVLPLGGGVVVEPPNREGCAVDPLP